MAASRKSVHLFVGDVLIEHEVDGEIFEVTSLAAVREQDGSIGFNL